MHIFMDAIGFSQLHSRTDFEKIAVAILESPTAKHAIELEDHTIFAEIKKDFSEDFGIALIGEYDRSNVFHMAHFYPYVNGTEAVYEEDLTINRRVDTDAYTGMSDDLRLGISLIFYLQNPVDYLFFRQKQIDLKIPVPIRLSALSIGGRILLGASDQLPSDSSYKQKKSQRNRLLKEAKRGNPEAINLLTLGDIDLYTTVSRRMLHEDLYSIVDTSFIPYGSESDNYTILGKIKEVSLRTNFVTREEIYILLLECNELFLTVAINRNNLLGIPLPGRRFKGNIWLQGHILFPR